MSFDVVAEKELLSPGHLRWACRRGMLELDILLGGFIDNGYEKLSLDEKLVFQDLLIAADQELIEYFMGQASPKDRESARVIEKIRSAVTA